MRDPKPESSRFESYESGFGAYEDGKHRRYELLFAVNGGAFAIANIFAEKGASPVLGSLTLSQLAIGMIAFTIVMMVDIYTFGLKMKRKLGDVFSPIGQIVLLLICLLICAGWFLVAYPDGP